MRACIQLVFYPQGKGVVLFSILVDISQEWKIKETLGNSRTGVMAQVV